MREKGLNTERLDSLSNVCSPLQFQVNAIKPSLLFEGSGGKECLNPLTSFEIL